MIRAFSHRLLSGSFTVVLISWPKLLFRSIQFLDVKKQNTVLCCVPVALLFPADREQEEEEKKREREE